MPSSPSPHLNSASCTGTGVAPPAGLRLLDQVREQVRYLHYSIRTEQAYVHRVRDYVRFQGMRHPRQMGADEIRAFLIWLSVERHVWVSTHRQALAALLFLYQWVFGQQLPWMDELERPQRKARLPVVMTQDEVRAVLGLLEGTHAVLARLLYGTGLRISEALQLRVRCGAQPAGYAGGVSALLDQPPSLSGQSAACLPPDVIVEVGLDLRLAHRWRTVCMFQHFHAHHANEHRDRRQADGGHPQGDRPKHETRSRRTGAENLIAASAAVGDQKLARQDHLGG